MVERARAGSGTTCKRAVEIARTTVAASESVETASETHRGHRLARRPATVRLVDRRRLRLRRRPSLRKDSLTSARRPCRRRLRWIAVIAGAAARRVTTITTIVAIEGGLDLVEIYTKIDTKIDTTDEVAVGLVRARARVRARATDTRGSEDVTTLGLGPDRDPRAEISAIAEVIVDFTCKTLFTHINRFSVRPFAPTPHS